MISFREYLEGIDGKCKSAAVANTVATDTFKAHRYAMPEVTSPKLETIIDHRKLMDYLWKMEQEGNCGLEGQLHFLDSEVNSVHDFL